MKLYLLIILNTIIISLAFAQEKKFIRQGNSAYQTGDYDNSELKYRKALEKKANSFDAGFNLGDALFKQEKFEEAVTQFENLTHLETSKENIAKAYHNLGNSFIQSKDEQGQPKLQEAVDAYKNALRNNPKDNETRFNLAQVQKMLKQQQQQQKQNKDQNKDQKDKDKKDENKDKKDEQKDQKDQKNKDQENKDKQDQKKQEQKQQQIPKEKAEQMLKALENDEKDLQKKMKMQKVKGQKVKVEKDW